MGEQENVNWLDEEVRRILGEILGRGKKTPEDPDAFVDTIEIDQTENVFEIGQVLIKSVEIEDYEDVEKVKGIISDKNIAIADITPLLEDSPVKLKDIVEELKKFCNEAGGDLARVSESKLLVTSKIARIEKK